jgi:hypothetical protein
MPPPPGSSSPLPLNPLAREWTPSFAPAHYPPVAAGSPLPTPRTPDPTTSGNQLSITTASLVPPSAPHQQPGATSPHADNIHELPQPTSVTDYNSATDDFFDMLSQTFTQHLPPGDCPQIPANDTLPSQWQITCPPPARLQSPTTLTLSPQTASQANLWTTPKQLQSDKTSKSPPKPLCPVPKF